MIDWQTVAAWAAVIGFVTLLVGLLVYGAGTPQTDRRFRTGYKQNQTPDVKLQKNGGMIALVGIIVFVGACCMLGSLGPSAEIASTRGSPTASTSQAIAPTIYDASVVRPSAPMHRVAHAHHDAGPVPSWATMPESPRGSAGSSGATLPEPWAHDAARPR